MHPREALGVAAQERLELREVAVDDGAVAVRQGVAVAQRERAQELARRRAADGGVVLQLEHAAQQLTVARREPSEAQAGQAVGLRHGAERHGGGELVARGRQAGGGVVLELAVDLVAEQHQVRAAGELEHRAVHLGRHEQAGRVVGRVHVQHPGARTHQRLEGGHVVAPVVLGAAAPFAHVGAGAARELQRGLVAGGLDDDVVAGPEQGVVQQEDPLLGAGRHQHVVGLEARVQRREWPRAAPARRGTACSSAAARRAARRRRPRGRGARPPSGSARRSSTA